jgi:hypothetical protein
MINLSDHRSEPTTTTTLGNWNGHAPFVLAVELIVLLVVIELLILDEQYYRNQIAKW